MVGDIRPLKKMVAFGDRKSTRLNSSHYSISYAVFCLKKNRKPPPTGSESLRPVTLSASSAAMCARRKLQEMAQRRQAGRLTLLGPSGCSLFFLMIGRPRGFTLFPSGPLFG